MKLKKIEAKKITLVLTDRSENKSKSITVYDTTVDEMLNAIIKMIKASAT